MGSSRYWSTDGFQSVMVRQDALASVEAAPDRRNIAHLVLHPTEVLDWSSGSESQKYAKTEHELRGLQDYCWSWGSTWSPSNRTWAMQVGHGAQRNIILHHRQHEQRRRRKTSTTNDTDGELDAGEHYRTGKTKRSAKNQLLAGGQQEVCVLPRILQNWKLPDETKVIQAKVQVSCVQRWSSRWDEKPRTPRLGKLHFSSFVFSIFSFGLFVFAFLQCSTVFFYLSLRVTLNSFWNEKLYFVR